MPCRISVFIVLLLLDHRRGFAMIFLFSLVIHPAVSKAMYLSRQIPHGR